MHLECNCLIKSKRFKEQHILLKKPSFNFQFVSGDLLQQKVTYKVTSSWVQSVYGACHKAVVLGTVDLRICFLRYNE